MRRRDLLTSLGGFLTGCNIPLASHRSLLRDPAAATPCASASLLAQQKFDCAQDDIQRFCLVVIESERTAKNLHDDAADSFAILAGYISERPKVVTVARRPF